MSLKRRVFVAQTSELRRSNLGIASLKRGRQNFVAQTQRVNRTFDRASEFCRSNAEFRRSNGGTGRAVCRPEQYTLLIKSKNAEV
jgi:hypothetical protein